jgi:hypothetical protein
LLERVAIWVVVQIAKELDPAITVLTIRALITITAVVFDWIVTLEDS